MPVPFGFSVGDFIAVGTLAWSVYKSTKGAADAFAGIHEEVLSLHAVIKEAEETVFRVSLPMARQERLKVIMAGCTSVLEDLQALVDKYQRLGQAKYSWKHFQWSGEAIAEYRQRLCNHATMLGAFVSTSPGFVEQQLNVLIAEVRGRSRASSVISSQTVESLSQEDKELWRAIRKELENVGVSVRAFDDNRDMIIDFLRIHVVNGDLDGDSTSDTTSGYGTEAEMSDGSPAVSPQRITERRRSSGSSASLDSDEADPHLSESGLPVVDR